MPATAGRVRMPANNRVHSSAALQTHGIWQSAIGYDPYAPNKDESKGSTSSQNNGSDQPGGENAYLSFQGLLQLARVTNANDNEARGACKKCGRVGHLTFQCKNFVSMKEEIKNKELDAIQGNVFAGLDKVKGTANARLSADSTEESSEDESESSDSSYDSEIERVIAKRYGQKASGTKLKSGGKKKHGSDEDEDSDSVGRKKRGRSETRSSRKRLESNSDSEDDSKREEKRRKRDELFGDGERRHRSRKSGKEKRRRRRRSHRHLDDSDESPRWHKRKSRRALSPSGSDAGDSDDSRVGRDAKRSSKRSHKGRLDKV